MTAPEILSGKMNFPEPITFDHTATADTPSFPQFKTTMNAAESYKPTAKRGRKKIPIPDPSTFDEKNTVCPPSTNFDGHDFTRKNINKGSVQFQCRYVRGETTECKCTLKFPRLPPSEGRPFGFWDPTQPELIGHHTRDCCVLNDKDPDDPDVIYAGKPYAEASFECTDVVVSPAASSPGESVVDLSHALPTWSDEEQRYLRFHEMDDALPSLIDTNHALSDASSKRQSTESFSDVSGSSGESPPKVRVVEKPPPAAYVSCGEEMKKRVKQLATENVRMLPDSIWTQVKQEMNEKYADCWTGKTREYVQGLVVRTRKEAGMGDKLKVLEDDPTLKNLPDGTPFLQFHGCYPHPDEPKETCRYMIFGSLTLIAVLLAAGLDPYASSAALERTVMSGCSLNFLKHSLISERTTMIRLYCIHFRFICYCMQYS